MDEVYPRDSEVFNSTDTDDRQPPKRIVSQHNLYNETKFTSSLFRTKPVRMSDSQDENVADSPTRGESGLVDSRNLFIRNIFHMHRYSIIAVSLISWQKLQEKAVRFQRSS